MRIGFITDHQCGRGHVSRSEAIAEVAAERGHEIVRHDSDPDWIIVDHYGFDWSTLPPNQAAVHVDDFGRPAPEASLHFRPLRHWALVRRAFRKQRRRQRMWGEVFFASQQRRLLAAEMAWRMAGAGVVVATPSVAAWEAACLGCPLVLIPTRENQALVADSLRGHVSIVEAGDNAGLEAAIEYERERKRGENLRGLCDGRGAYRIVEEMERAMG